MAGLSLKSLLRANSEARTPVTALLSALEGPLAIEDTAGNVLLGAALTNGAARVPLVYGEAVLGSIVGPRTSAEALGSLLMYLAGRETERRALAAEVLHLYREVHLIEQLSEQLAALLDVSAVGNSALAQARRLIAASSGGVLVRERDDAGPRYAAAFGDPSALPGLDSVFTASVLDGRAGEIMNTAEIVNGYPPVERGAVADFRSIVFAPLRAKQRTLGIIVLTNEAGDPYTAGDLKLLNTIALQTAAAIENALLCADMVQAAQYREQLAAIQRELDTARSIQHSLVPRAFPPFPERTDFEIHAQMNSARTVGGDFFDFFLIDSELLGVVIGDVSGKGMPAALYMAMAHAHVRTVALQNPAPASCMAEVNRILVREKVSYMYATCFYGVLNTRTGELLYATAGHNPPYLIRGQGTVEPLDVVGGTPLGMLPLDRYESGSAQLCDGDALFLYTDGVPEAKTSSDEDFTDERLIRLLNGAGDLSPRALIDMVNSHVLDFTAGAPASDDVTMLAVRLTGRSGSRSFSNSRSRSPRM